MNLDDLAARGWIDIDELVAWIDDNVGFDDSFLQGAVLTAKKSRARQMIRTMLDRAGNPRFASVTITDDAGRTQRIYKQESLFDVGDYVTVIAYHQSCSRHHAYMAKAYRERGEQRFGNALYLFDPDPVPGGAS